MENPILDFSVTLAKPALVRVDDALRAHMAGARASASAATAAQAVTHQGVRSRPQGWCRSRHRRRHCDRIIAVCGRARDRRE